VSELQPPKLHVTHWRFPVGELSADLVFFGERKVNTQDIDASLEFLNIARRQFDKPVVEDFSI
jgi:hypothetical protein